MLTLDKIYHASYVLKDVIRRTELIHAPNINKKCNIYLKPENLQLTGSFKVRGSYYKISQLSEEEKAKGVIACSAGNHAQGVALAATKNGIKSIICLPDGAPISKVEATKNYGADICLVEGVYDDAYKRAIELRDEMGYTFIHPFDDIDVIAGQGTIGLELIDQMKDVDAVIETKRGHNLGRVLQTGSAAPNTGIPGIIGGFGKERVIHCPAEGILRNVKKITDTVSKGEVIAVVETEDGTVPVKATLNGILRGLIRDGYPVQIGFKMADIDPRIDEYNNCFTISDKARCIAGGVLEAILQRKGELGL